MKPSNNEGKGKARNIIGKIISILLSVLLMVGSLYIAQGNSEESHAYNVVLTFKINETYYKTYTVYIPPVKPNDWIKIYGAVNSHVDVNLTVQIDSWITNEIEIPPFM